MVNTYLLNGQWELCLDSKKEGLSQELYKQDAWKKQMEVKKDTIELPGTTDLAKKGTENENRELGFLTQEYVYEGYAWYQKTITLNEQELGLPMKLYFERTRKTKLWVNECYVGAQDSMVAPHIYEISEFVKEKEVRLTILVDNTEYKTKGGHMTSPDTQTNWNGIIGKMELRIYDPIYISQINVYPNVKKLEAEIVLEIENTTGAFCDEVLTMSVDERKGQHLTQVQENIGVDLGRNQFSFCVKLPEETKLWSEHAPNLYQLSAKLVSTTVEESVVFGMREFLTTEDKFTINGEATFLRGKSEALLFPLTGCSPMTVEEWLEVMQIARNYGINHYRCHTCCLPDAAFTAADLLGIYVQPEISFWGTITVPGEEGYNEEEQQYLFEEGLRMLEAYGNHPSFVMLTLGNELWGSEDRMNEMMKAYREKDPRHLYAQGCNNFMWVPKVLKEDDFFIGVRTGAGKLIRGSFARCDAPQGFVQTMAPTMSHNYDEFLRPDLMRSKKMGLIKGNENLEKEAVDRFEYQGNVNDDTTLNSDEKVSKEKVSKKNMQDKKENTFEIQYETGVKVVSGSNDSDQLISHVPVLNHEIGQYSTYPNFKEINKYTGVLKARNFEAFQERLKEKGMLDQDELFFLASGKLSGFLYKLEIEAALRSEYLAGYQLLDLQDFTGQGTALVGILDSFLEEKGTVSKEEWTSFCNEVVLLAEFDTFVLENGSTFEPKIKLSNYSGRSLKGETLGWTLEELDCQEETFQYGKSSKLLAQEDSKEVTKFKSWQKVKRVVQEGIISIDTDQKGLIELNQLTIQLPKNSACVKYRLRLHLMDTPVVNHYDLWSYPKADDNINSVAEFFECYTDSKELYLKSNCQEESRNKVHITKDYETMMNYLLEGKKVLYLPEKLKKSIPGEFATDFWNYPMFRSISEWMKKPIPIGTMGLLIDNEHPMLNDYISEIYSTPQWYQMIQNSEFLILDEVEKEFRPIVQMIDNFERTHKLGMFLEARVGTGSLLVCTARLDEIIKKPEVQSLVASIKVYLESSEFAPTFELSENEIRELLLPM